MDSNKIRLTIPVKCFIAGIIPYILYTLLGYFEMLNLHGGPGTLFILLLVVIVPPICFTGGFIEALRSGNKDRRIGIALNGLGLAFLFFWMAGGIGWLTN